MDLQIRRAILVVACMSALSEAACSTSGEPTYRGEAGCLVASAALCAGGRGPMAFSNGDPMLDVCMALGDGFGTPFARVPSTEWVYEGITRVTAEYDDAGRVVAYQSDCGLGEPYWGEFDWNADGRLARYRGRVTKIVTVDRTPVFDAGLLVAFESAYLNQETGMMRDSRVDYGRDGAGHIISSDGEGGWGPYHNDLVFEGDALVRVTYDGFVGPDLAQQVETIYSYDDDGRLIERDRTYDPDYTPDDSNMDIDIIEWTSTTEARISVNSDSGTIEILLDEMGRLVRKDTRSAATGHNTATWERDDEGRLVEFWNRGE